MSSPGKQFNESDQYQDDIMEDQASPSKSFISDVKMSQGKKSLQKQDSEPAEEIINDFRESKENK